MEKKQVSRTTLITKFKDGSVKITKPIIGKNKFDGNFFALKEHIAHMSNSEIKYQKLL